MLMDISLHQLRLFRSVAREGSFTRAAEQLFVSQPGISLQIKALEQCVGQPLFDRVGRTIHLTEGGRELLTYCERIFALLDEAELVLEELAGGRRGTVRTVASTSAGIYVVPAALGAFHQLYPEVRLSLDVLNRLTAQARLLTNEADIGVMGLIEDAHGLEVAEFVPNELVVIAPPSHPLARRPGITLAELASETLLVREAGSGTRLDAERLFAAHGLQPCFGMELRSSGAIKQAVAAGLGVAIMPLAALELELQVGRVAVLDVIGFPMRRAWSLARRAGGRHSAAAAALWRYLLAYRDALACAGEGHLTSVPVPGAHAAAAPGMSAA